MSPEATMRRRGPEILARFVSDFRRRGYDRGVRRVGRFLQPLLSEYWVLRQLKAAAGMDEGRARDEPEHTRRWWDVTVSGGPARRSIRPAAGGDGGYRWHLGPRRGARSRGSHSEVDRHAIDIHEQVLGEERLRASEARYRNLVELSRDAIYIRTGGRFVSANAATARLYGAASVDELVGHPVLPFIHADYVDIVQERMRKLDEEHCELPPLN